MLSILIFLPIIGALFLLLIPKDQGEMIKRVAFFISLLVLALSLSLFVTYEAGTAGFSELEKVDWLPSLGISYQVGVDGISLFLVMLTTVIVPILLFAPWEAIKERIKLFSVMILLLEGAVVGVFLALDLILFYVFWEMMLIPMYFIIGIWGGERGSFAAMKFFIYTMATSVLMLVAIIWIGANAGTFDVLALQGANILTGATFLFLAFAAAFAVKVPLWPFHSWLPDAYSEAPTSGTILLSALMSKAGLYGFIRFGLGLFPESFMEYAPYLMILALVGVIYGALVAWAQKDLKRLVAYSSISHLGLVAIGIFAFTTTTTAVAFPGLVPDFFLDVVGANGSITSLTGAIMQMVNHGIIIAALFLALSVLWDRFGKRSIEDFGGLARVMPRFMILFLIAMLGSVALPGTSGFVGEFLILVGTFATQYQLIAIIAASMAILSAIYMLWMTQRVFHEPLNENAKETKDLSGREAWALIPLVALILIMGVFPNLWLDRITPSVVNMMPEEIQIELQDLAETEREVPPPPAEDSEEEEH